MKSSALLAAHWELPVALWCAALLFRFPAGPAVARIVALASVVTFAALWGAKEQEP